MRKRVMLFAAPLCVVAIAASVAVASPSDAEHSRGPKLDKLHAERPIAATTGTAHISTDAALFEAEAKAIQDYVKFREVTDYIRFRMIEDVLQYIAAVDQANYGAYLASLAKPQLMAPPSVPSGGGGACGGATNGADGFIMRESGGNPNIYNPSGAWGCYQIMPATWAGAGCDRFGAYGSASAAVQAQCASLLPLSAWASSGPT